MPVKQHPSIEPPSASSVQFATDIIRQTFLRTASSTFLSDLRADLKASGAAAAIRTHDTPALFQWLMSTLSYQGISDGVAETFIAEHGQVSWDDVDRLVGKRHKCSLLESYWHFDRCNYRKEAHTCSSPRSLRSCGLPCFPLRNGRLNQTAMSLFLFIRDVADGDLLGWIDARLAEVSGRHQENADFLLNAFRGIFGVADKMASMVLSTMLLGSSKKGTAKFETGASFIVVDTLVHNFLHRTGVLRELQFEHAYGTGCYSDIGCAKAIRLAAAEIDTTQIDPNLPRRFPRLVQHALWRFCAERDLDICNGNRVRDGFRCANRFCLFTASCKRVALPRSAKKAEK